MEIAVQATTWEATLEMCRLAPELEDAGADCVWVGEAYGSDALTALGYVAARTSRLKLATGILNVYSRSAAVVAMSMVGLDRLSDGRAVCGLGTSGPGVVETLHGVPFELPLSRLKAYTAVCRQLWAGERAQVKDRALQVPLREGAKPMKLLVQPVSPIGMWWASLGDASVSAAAQLADGWLPFLFLPDRWERVWGEAVRTGLAERDAALGQLQVAADVTVAIGEDYVGERADLVLAEHRRHLALHIGGMGPRGRNAYNTVASRYGFEAEAGRVQDLYLGGERQAAEQALPEELLHGTALVGPPAYVRERLAAYREAGVTMLNVTFAAPDAVAQTELLRSACDA